MSLPDPYPDPWRHFRPVDFSPRNDPDGQLAEAYHREKGVWPPGSRQHWEADRKEREERNQPFNYAAHPSAGPPPRPATDPGDPFSLSLITLRPERLRAQMRIRLDSLLMASVKADVVRHEVDFMYEELVLRLQAHVLREDIGREHVTASERITHTTEHFGPATWRDFWKLTYGHRWWARWWVRRHPARVIEHPQTTRWVATATFDLEKYRTYPHADVRIRNRLGPDIIHFPVPTTVHTVWSQQ